MLPKKRELDSPSTTGILVQIGFSLGSSVIGGFVLGIVIEKRYPHHNLWVICGVFAGIILGFYYLFKLLKQFDNR